MPDPTQIQPITPSASDVDPIEQPQQTVDPAMQVRDRAKSGYDKMVANGVKKDVAKKETEKFLNNQIGQYHNVNPEVQKTTIKPVVTEDGIFTELSKSVWNGFAPPVLKMLPDLASIGTNAAGLHSDAIDNIQKDWTEWVDKNVGATIDPEHNKGIFQQNENGEWGLTNARSVINGLGNGIGTVANFIALAYLTGGAGDIAEAANSIKLAQAAGDAEALAKATQAYKSAQTAITMQKAISGTLLFMPQIYEDGQKAGLKPEDNARMSLLLGPALGLMGTFGGGEQKLLEKMLAGDALTGIEEATVNKLSDKGILSGLKGLSSRGLTEEEFKTAANATLTDAAAMSKKLLNSEVLKTTAKESAQMYLQSAVETSGKQLFDNLYGQNATEGHGKFGAEEFVPESSPEGVGPSMFGYKVKKNAFYHDLESGIYGGVLGAAMASYHTPVVNQSLYGFVESKIRAGKGEEGVKKLHMQADKLLKDGKLSQDAYDKLVGSPEIPAQPATDTTPEVEGKPAQKGMIQSMAETAQLLRGVNGDKITPTASYDAYNWQENERPKYDAQIASYEKNVQDLQQIIQSEPNNTTKLAAAQKVVAENYSPAKNSIASREAITKHVAGIAATGEMSPIRETLSKIGKENHDWESDESLKPLMQGYEPAKTHAESQTNPDENGITHADLHGQPVVHVPSGEHGSVVKGSDGNSEFQPSVGGEPVHLGKGEDVVDRNIIDHKVAKKEDKSFPISSIEYSKFVDKNKVSPLRLNLIAEKVMKSEKLSAQEQEMYAAKSKEVESKIKEKHGTVQKQEPREVDVRQQAEDGKTVGEGNAESKVVAEQGEEASQEEKVKSDGFLDELDALKTENLGHDAEALSMKPIEDVKAEVEAAKDLPADDTHKQNVQLALEMKEAESKEIDTQISEIADKPAVEDAFEEIADDVADKKVAKSKIKKKSGEVKISKKQKSELLFSEPNSVLEMAMQHVLGNGDLEEGERMTDAEAIKEMTDVWNSDHTKKIGREEVAKALSDASKLEPNDIAQKLMQSFGGEKGKVLRTIGEREKYKQDLQNKESQDLKDKLSKLNEEIKPCS